MLFVSSPLTWFLFNATAPTMIYTLSLHDALPISARAAAASRSRRVDCESRMRLPTLTAQRSEEHTSELQSHSDLVCRLLLEKKNQMGTGEHARNSRRCNASRRRGQISRPRTPRGP